MKTNPERTSILTRLTLLFATATTLPLLNAAQLAFAPNGATAGLPSTLQVELGTRFSVSQTLSLAGLAYYDSGADGFAGPHRVSLWDDVGNLITSVTVSNTSSLLGPDFGGGQFRFENVALTLNPGIYRLSGARSPINFVTLDPDPDAIMFDNSAPNGDLPWAAPGIVYLGRVCGPDGSAAGAFPSVEVTGANADDWFGPNLVLANEVPEPCTTVLALVAAAIVFRSRK